MVNKTIQKELIDSIIQLHQSGLNPNAIGNQLDISKTTVIKYLLAQGIQPHSRDSVNTQKKIQEFVNLVQNGVQQTKARKQAKLSYEISIQALLDHDIKPSTRKDGAQTKALTLDDYSKRVPNGVKILSKDDQSFTLQNEIGEIYTRVASRLSSPHKQRNKTFSDVKKVLDGVGYEILEQEYQSSKKPISAICRKCGTIRTTRYALFITQGCPTCTNTGVSKPEKFIENHLIQHNIQTSKFKFKGNKTKPQEIDIYVPSVNLGIEYCGLYWHCENSPQPRMRNYHKDKMDNANENGIQLLTVFEDEWLDRSYQVLSYIESKVGIFQHKVYARNCVTKVILPEIAKSFLSTYHIQGPPHLIQIAIGLYYNDELVGVMTGSRHHRDIGISLVLSRMAFARGYQIVGGASKMFALFLPQAKQNGYSHIISWSDNRWSEGKVYKALGFILEDELPPDYSYVKKQKRHSKQSLKKNKEERSSGKTEWELRREQGYDRIWDCGKKRWGYTII